MKYICFNILLAIWTISCSDNMEVGLTETNHDNKNHNSSSDVKKESELVDSDAVIEDLADDNEPNESYINQTNQMNQANQVSRKSYRLK